MKVLLVGGSGRVGSFITPYLRKQHDLRVLDLAPPKHDLEEAHNLSKTKRILGWQPRSQRYLEDTATAPGRSPGGPETG